jgi:hypothetical protein
MSVPTRRNASNVMNTGSRLIGTEDSYREHRILGVWGREVRCKSPNLGPPEPKCTDFWCFGTMSDTIFTENLGQLILSDAGTRPQASSMMHP